jgi:hypothetical protein
MSAPNTTADLYAILEVAPSASPEVIEAAFRGLMRKYGESPDADVRARRADLERAYEVLSSSSKRAEYDASRGSTPPAPSKPEPETPAYRPVTVVECPRDPGVETALRCGRCDTPICPKCMIQGPVGTRCKDCAKLSKNPIYTLTREGMMRAAAAAVIGGVVMGVVWGLVLYQFSFGFFSIFLGLGLGWAFTRALDFATGRKRGPTVAAFAMAGIGIAYLVMVAIVPWLWVFGLLPAGIGAYFAYQNLKAF